MSPGSALVAALTDMYQQSWRLFLLNACLSAIVLPVVVVGLWLWPAWLLLIAAGPLAAALMHCAVVVTVTEELRLRDAVTGLRMHWRRGLVLGATFTFLVGVGLYAVSFYAGKGAMVLAALASYLLLALIAYQLVLWPIAVYEQARPIRRILEEAGRSVMSRPIQAVLLTVALVAVNVAGLVAAVVPFLTLTVAYSFLAAAHFALPPTTKELESWPA